MERKTGLRGLPQNSEIKVRLDLVASENGI